MKLQRLIVVLLFFLSNAGSVCATYLAPPLAVETVRYYYLGSFKSIVGRPKGNGPFPVVIYSYDEFYDWSGRVLANNRGYVLEDIARYFARLGYVCVIPIQRYRRVSAILGVAHYIRNKPFIKQDQLHLVGMSEGAYMNFIAAEKAPLFASMTAIAPIIINEKGYLSKFEFWHRSPALPHMPVFFMMVYDVGWRINSQQDVLGQMRTRYNTITVKRFDREKRWFWNISRYGRDVHRFIRRIK